jgi:hypothetical protein
MDRGLPFSWLPPMEAASTPAESKSGMEVRRRCCESLQAPCPLKTRQKLGCCAHSKAYCAGATVGHHLLVPCCPDKSQCVSTRPQLHAVAVDVRN